MKLNADSSPTPSTIGRVSSRLNEIKPSLYVFDGDYIYILATRYGEKLRYLEGNPRVTVEIERYSEDMSDYKFVTLSGRLTKMEDEESKGEVREKFVELIRGRGLSKNVMVALGHSRDEPVEAISEGDRTHVFKLVDVEKITGLKKGE